MYGQQFLKRLRQRLGKRDDFAGDGLGEADGGGVQREAAGQRVQRRAVEVVARDRAADVRKVHADLVRAPGLQPQPKKRPVP